MCIGILTFHNANNYGAVLQAYCLQETLRFAGFEVEIIDYRNPLIEKKMHPFSFFEFIRNPFLFSFRALYSFSSYKHRVANFDRFRTKYLFISKRYKAKDLKIAPYDYLIIGSDQVWNPVLTDGPDLVYWGQYCSERTKLIGYAISSGAKELFNNDVFLDVSKWLSCFKWIGVRERRLKEFANQHGKEATVVLDPTLMADPFILECITSKRIVEYPYVLVYAVGTNHSLMQIAMKKATILNAKIIVVAPCNKRTRKIYEGAKIIDASIPELLSLIKYAECIVCVSFHGTALSLVFEKNFISVNGGNIERVLEVLTRLGLEDRIVSNDNNLPEKEIDYVKVTRQLNMLRKKSKEELLNLL
ncbi:polysaccharide pyruvyl transferase family protein [Phocaeicola sp.]|uniref:polysaccharide pyruvyl transferase family protein n=1 Tax=Phocaeicola sp. TaxID=2773926 RepID=UPI0023CCC592|nr:polysaccharide pyruvyl transferase family protein [Phocaeicola sp.]MDE5678733.1 polysaccharide pyruvyl transferase family protein [Phocaeicola sp.]